MKCKTKFICLKCHFKVSKWYGQCSNCQNWNTFEEEQKKSESSLDKKIKPLSLSSIDKLKFERLKTNNPNLDELMGGGYVKGSLNLLSGPPGVGKSTYLMKVCDEIADRDNVLYVCTEESLRSISERAKRLKIKNEKIYFYKERSVEDIVEQIQILKPAVLVIDSLQAIEQKEFRGLSSTSIKEIFYTLEEISQKNNMITIFVSHITKDEKISGPKYFEHMVDTIITLKENNNFHILKNRFGPSNIQRECIL